MNFVNMFLGQSSEIRYGTMAALVFLVTFIFGIAVKRFTHKIKDENLRKALNGILFVIAIMLGFLTEYVYSMVAKIPFKIDYAVVIGCCGISTNEGIKIVKYYIMLIVAKIKSGEKITNDELLKPLDELINTQVAETVIVPKETEKKDDIAQAQEDFEKLLK